MILCSVILCDEEVWKVGVYVFIILLQPSSEPLELPAPPALTPQQLQLLQHLQQNEVRSHPPQTFDGRHLLIVGD